MDSSWDKVREFHQRFDVPDRDTPSLLGRGRVEKRAAWMKEELEEFRRARSVEEQADAMIDLMYLALGTLVEMGVRPKALFDIVHEANMGKLWPDGKPRRRESDGKVIKPPDWKDPMPKIRNEILRQNGDRRE
ncbi:HAD family hydrolase [Staphylospora marina]|uniref:HAD family hydrolase n=1 Tax=Staphylospora marina TaxID=2490858 RepID=UPI000F5BC163|nr:HAD family hydrolase [Staphylospora marina]